MFSSFKLPERNSVLFLILAIIYSVVRLPVLFFLPLVKDENIYAIMIEEQVHNPTLIPTVFGYSVSWKPVPFFWIYALMSRLPLPLEVAYRLPSFLFGLASLIPLYYVLRNVGASRNVAFFSLLAFIASFVTIYPHVALLTDSLLFFLISCSLYLYTEKKFGDWRFLAAGLLAFFAFFIKLVIAFMVPLLAVAYLFSTQRELLKKPIFLLSLLAVPLAFLLHFILLDNIGLAEELFVSDIGGHILTGTGLASQFKLIWGSMNMMLSGAGIWFALSLFGLWKYWRKEKFMAFWYLLIMFPILTGYFMPWYYLPVFPAVSYFAVLALLKWEGEEKADKLFTAFMAMAVIATILLSASIFYSLYITHITEKEIGLFLVGKENVMVVGDYWPGILTYKMATEYRSSEEALDIGWVMSTPCTFSGEKLEAFVQDYYTDEYPVVDGSFTSFFTKREIFRKDTNITDFDYVVVANRDAEIPGGELIYSKNALRVYQVN